MWPAKGKPREVATVGGADWLCHHSGDREQSVVLDRLPRLKPWDSSRVDNPAWCRFPPETTYPFMRDAGLWALLQPAHRRADLLSIRLRHATPRCREACVHHRVLVGEHRPGHRPHHRLNLVYRRQLRSRPTVSLHRRHQSTPKDPQRAYRSICNQTQEVQSAAQWVTVLSLTPASNTGRRSPDTCQFVLTTLMTAPSESSLSSAIRRPLRASTA